ncbi:MAG: DUF1553 domain-containing protein [Pirellulales bacterium]
MNKSSAHGESYSTLVLADEPIAYWQFESSVGEAVTNHPSLHEQYPLLGKLHGNMKFGTSGPRPDGDKFGYRNFTNDNQAVSVQKPGSFIAINDPGELSSLDFDMGDSITLEAWVDLDNLRDNENVYILGKGRTNRSGFTKDNQNYALRLRGKGDTACVSFLFRDADNKPGDQKHWHRWTSNSGFYAGTTWHHVAVSYTFGEPDSIRGYIDGELVSGTWDMGGKSAKAPVVDNDQLWIGSSLGGSAGNTFRGNIDEVAIYRTAIPEDRIQKRYQFESPEITTSIEELPEDAVLVQLTERIPDSKSWKIPRLPITESYEQPSFVMTAVPNKYNNKGLISDRSKTILLKASAAIDFNEGEHEFLFRSLGGARLWIDGKLISTNRFLKPGGDAHNSVPDLPAAQVPDMRPLPPGHAETLVTKTLAAGTHLVTIELLVGGSKVRLETGEFGLYSRQGENQFTLMSPRSDYKIALTDEAWDTLAKQERNRLRQQNLDRRRLASAEEDKYWQARHQVAKQYTNSLPKTIVPLIKNKTRHQNAIDSFITVLIEKANAKTSPLSNDDTFIRRVYLDTVGVVPTEEEQNRFAGEPEKTRRSWLIDQLLADPRAADHWTPYWQDVLAENPGILKPKLNNSGPFRWWIYESLLENKPIDRFATELIMMEGSIYYGGPAGFSVATQNDVPMAAKAHIIGQAFQAVEMKCARCHDAPYHDVTQADLFSLAAMLKMSPQEIPKTSSVPLGDDEESNSSLITVSTKPGTKVPPRWPFPDLITGYDFFDLSIFTRDITNTREQLAASITSPKNQRFPKVIVNRLWQRYFGVGIVSSVDDWELSSTSHPELLDYLARQLVENNYDLQHISRLILNSHAYQRACDSELAAVTLNEMPLFAAQSHRRLSAEQVLDSLFVTAGKPLNSETLTMDPLNILAIETFLNLGKPQRAWQFTSLSNERDRPSLAIPKAQSLVDVLTSFGWRAMRQNPVSVRDDTPVVQQPAILANGSAARHVIGFSDDSQFTKIALDSKSTSEVVTRVYRQILSRKPSREEAALFTELLSSGFNERKTGKPPAKKEKLRFSVSWTNHLSKEANEMKIRLEEEVRRGDPSTPQLTPAWRERAEDMVWALINSPEFVFTP